MTDPLVGEDPASMDYVLDTSVIRALGRDRLRAAGRRATLLVSPVSLYELLSHLEDPSGAVDETPDETFARNRGGALLCRHLRMLDDPFVELGVGIGAGNEVANGRFMERPILERLLRALEVSRDIEDFYRREIPLEDGSTGSLRDIGSGLVSALAELEDEYVNRINDYDALLKSRYCLEEIRALAGPPLYQIIEHGVAIMGERIGLSEPIPEDTLARVRFAAYPHLGYLVARSIQYSVNAGRSGSPQVNRNDAEDSRIACHLSVDKSRILVTRDTGFHSTMRAAFQAFSEVVGVDVQCGIQGMDDFVRQFEL